VLEKKYGAVLFGGELQLKLFPEKKMKPFEWYQSAAQFE